MIEKFFVLAVRETENWDSEFLASCNAREAFGLYMIRDGERTHLCSLSPSSRADWLQNVFILDSPENEPWGFDRAQDAAQSARESAELESGDEYTTYFNYVDRKKRDSRFVGNVIEIESRDLGLPRRRADWADSDIEKLWDAAREAFSTGAADEPAILCESIFAAWEAEQLAKARAENRPPLDCREQLPLFAAAVESHRKATGVDIGAIDWEAGKAEWKQWQALGWAR